MDPDDLPYRASTDPLAALARQDLGPLSAGELEERIQALLAEISRCEDRLDQAINHKATAEGLFKR